MKVLVAGGAGIVGVRLADAFLGAGHRVVVYDDMSGEHSGDGARWLDRRRNATGRLMFAFRNVRDSGELERAVDGCDAVVHAAAPPEGSEDARELAVRVQGTLAILDAIERRAPSAHLVLLSEALVYGSPALVRGGTAMFATREAQILAPETPAAAAAACAEQYAFAAARGGGRKATVIRLPVVYASDALFALSDGWPARLVSAARGGAAIAPPVDPRWPVDLVHVEDVASAIDAILAKPALSVGEAFNVGGGARSAPSMWELVQHLADLGSRARLLPPLAGQRPSPVLDVSRIGKILEWEPKVAWRDGLARLFAVAPASEGTPQAATQALVAWPRAEGLA